MPLPASDRRHLLILALMLCEATPLSTAPISLGCLLRTVCTIVILLVFCSSSVLAQHRQTVDRPASSLTPRQDVKVYRDMTRFLENRLIKLRGIVQRAHTAQRKIRRSPLKGGYGRTPEVFANLAKHRATGPCHAGGNPTYPSPEKKRRPASKKSTTPSP